MTCDGQGAGYEQRADRAIERCRARGRREVQSERAGRSTAQNKSQIVVEMYLKSACTHGNATPDTHARPDETSFQRSVDNERTRLDRRMSTGRQDFGRDKGVQRGSVEAGDALASSPSMKGLFSLPLSALGPAEYRGKQEVSKLRLSGRADRARRRSRRTNTPDVIPAFRIATGIPVSGNFRSNRQGGQRGVGVGELSLVH